MSNILDEEGRESKQDPILYSGRIRKIGSFLADRGQFLGLSLRVNDGLMGFLSSDS